MTLLTTIDEFDVTALAKDEVERAKGVLESCVLITLTTFAVHHNVEFCDNGARWGFKDLDGKWMEDDVFTQAEDWYAAMCDEWGVDLYGEGY